MDDILFEILKVVIMVAVLLVTRYLVPWLKSKIDYETVDAVSKWVTEAVLWAEQVYYAKTGPERKQIVVDYIKLLLTQKNISITDEQLNTLIEAAVKQMRIAENSDITIKTEEVKI